MLHQEQAQQPRVLDIPQVAHIIGRSELATRRAIERGQIPARRGGRRVVVLADDLDKFLASLPARPMGYRT
jgi:hypothetical protein